MQYNVDVNSQGEWNLDVFDNVKIGSHAVKVFDNYGNDDVAIFQIKGDEQFKGTYVQGVEIKDLSAIQIPGEMMNPIIFATLGFLLFVVVAFVIDILLAKKIQKKKNESKTRMRKIAVRIMALSSSLVIFLLLTTVYLGNEYRKINLERRIDVQLPEESVISLVGALRDPITFNPVAGVSLSSGNISINTSESGSFNFSNIKKNEGLLISSSDLLKGIIFLPPRTGDFDIFYNADLYNDLILVTDAQINYDYRRIRDSLDENLLGVTDIVIENNLPQIFVKEGNLQGVLKVVNIERINEFRSGVIDYVYNNVVRITVYNDGKIGGYNFIKDGDVWKIVL